MVKFVRATGTIYSSQAEHDLDHHSLDSRSRHIDIHFEKTSLLFSESNFKHLHFLKHGCAVEEGSAVHIDDILRLNTNQ